MQRLFERFHLSSSQHRRHGEDGASEQHHDGDTISCSSFSSLDEDINDIRMRDVDDILLHNNGSSNQSYQAATGRQGEVVDELILFQQAIRSSYLESQQESNSIGDGDESFVMRDSGTQERPQQHQHHRHHHQQIEEKEPPFANTTMMMSVVVIDEDSGAITEMMQQQSPLSTLSGAVEEPSYNEHDDDGACFDCLVQAELLRFGNVMGETNNDQNSPRCQACTTKLNYGTTAATTRKVSKTRGTAETINGTVSPNDITPHATTHRRSSGATTTQRPTSKPKMSVRQVSDGSSESSSSSPPGIIEKKGRIYKRMRRAQCKFTQQGSSRVASSTSPPSLTASVLDPRARNSSSPTSTTLF